MRCFINNWRYYIYFFIWNFVFFNDHSHFLNDLENFTSLNWTLNFSVRKFISRSKYCIVGMETRWMQSKRKKSEMFLWQTDSSEFFYSQPNECLKTAYHLKYYQLLRKHLHVFVHVMSSFAQWSAPMQRYWRTMMVRFNNVWSMQFSMSKIHWTTNKWA